MLLSIRRRRSPCCFTGDSVLLGQSKPLLRENGAVAEVTKG